MKVPQCDPPSSKLGVGGIEKCSTMVIPENMEIYVATCTY